MFRYWLIQPSCFDVLFVAFFLFILLALIVITQKSQGISHSAKSYRRLFPHCRHQGASYGALFQWCKYILYMYMLNLIALHFLSVLFLLFFLYFPVHGACLKGKFNCIFFYLFPFTKSTLFWCKHGFKEIQLHIFLFELFPCRKF